MEFDQVVKERRSTRKFLTKEVSREDILKLIESARLSPSAANRQPWHFVILKGGKKDDVAKIMQKQLQQSEVILNHVNYATQQYNATSSLINSIRIIKEVPYLILVLKNKSDDFKEADYLSIGSAVEHICLKATDLKLGSLWIRDVVYAKDKIIEMLDYDNMELVTSVAIGYSSDYSPKREKKKIEDIMKWYDI